MATQIFDAAHVPAKPAAPIASPPPAPAKSKLTLRDKQSRGGSLALYGDTRSGKTRECAAIALYVWKTFGKRTRYITVDGGSYEPLLPLIEAGIVEVLDLTSAEGDLLHAIRAVSLGLWLEDGEWKRPEKQRGFGDVGCVIFETLSTLSSLIIRYYVDKNIKVSEDLIGYTVLTADDEQLVQALGRQVSGTISRSHYNALARELTTLVTNCRAMCNLFPAMELMVYTLHDGSNEQERVGMKTITLGPSTEGSKFGREFPRHVGDLIYTVVVPSADKRTVEYRAYFTPYVDPSLAGKQWPASLRGGAEVTSALKKLPEFAQGYIVLTDEENPVQRRGVTRILEARASIVRDATNELMQLVPANVAAPANEQLQP